MKPTGRQLNAYVDGQLDTSTRRRLSRLLLRDPVAHERVRSLMRLRDLVRMAYEHCPEPIDEPRSAPPQKHARPRGPSGDNRF
jgi:anti-sigma factor RsiW